MRQTYRSRKLEFKPMPDVPPPDGAINLYGPIVDDSTRSYLEEFGVASISGSDFRSKLEKIEGDVVVRINSPGGDVAEASIIQLAIRERIADKDSVVGIIEGEAYSAASLVTLSMTKVQMTELATTMIHSPWVAVMGTAGDLRKAAERLDELQNTIVSAYATKMNKDQDEIKDMLEEETFLTAKEAHEIGLVDDIISLAGDKDRQFNWADVTSLARQLNLGGTQ